MAKYRPLPRTLADIVFKLAAEQPEATQLIDPALLAQQKIPLLSPEELFGAEALQNIPKETGAAPQLKSPEDLFGEESFAKPGQKLLKIEDLKKRKPTE